MDALRCASCGATLGAGDVDRRLGIVACGHCGAIYDLTQGGRRAGSEQGPAVRPDEPREAPRYRPDVPMPARFDVRREPDALEVSWRWFGAQHVFLAFFAVAWNAFLVFWYAIAGGLLLSGEGGPEVVIMIVFPVAHVAVGVGVAYTALTGFINRTTVRVVRAGELTVRHGPLWWPRQPTLRSADVEQLYVERKVTHGKNGSTTTFNLHVVTRDHADLPLLTGLDDDGQALWLEAEVEGLLGLRDRRVPGEHLG